MHLYRQATEMSIERSINWLVDVKHAVKIRAMVFACVEKQDGNRIDFAPATYVHICSPKAIISQNSPNPHTQL